MQRSLASAAAIVMNTPEAERTLRTELPSLSDRLITTIPNGFDGDDFCTPAPEPASRFRIVHAGHLHLDHSRAPEARPLWRRLLGGERVAVDRRTRSHLFLTKAIAEWVRVEPWIRERIEVVLVGPYSAADVEVVREHGIEAMVSFTGYVPHAVSVEEMRRADLLFLPMHKLPPGQRARIVPSKMYEYLASGRPILAAVPAGDALDWLASCGRATICAPDDVSAMVSALKEGLVAKGHIHPQFKTDDPMLQRFERAKLTGMLAHLLDFVVEGTVHGSVPVASRFVPSAFSTG
jgi:glycosyltransferase involved in cell wall biosynthesis